MRWSVESITFEQARSCNSNLSAGCPAGKEILLSSQLFAFRFCKEKIRIVSAYSLPSPLHHYIINQQKTFVKYAHDRSPRWRILFNEEKWEKVGGKYLWVSPK